jgi:hypothetical protein
MNDNVSPSLQPLLAPIPFEAVGAAPRRASERDRDNAALALAGCIIALLKFHGYSFSERHREGLLERANKVRRSQGNGDVTFVHDTAERIRAAAEPGFSRGAFDDIEAEIARQMAEPSS